MHVIITTNYQGLHPAWMPQRMWNNLLKEAYRAAGEHWHRTYLPRHFEPGAAQRYGYTPRKGAFRTRGSKAWKRSYLGRKERDVGHTIDLVYTGESRTLARIRNVRATFKQVRVVLASRKYNLKHPKSDVRMYKEVTATTSDEEQRLIRMFMATLFRQRNAASYRRTVRAA